MLYILLFAVLVFSVMFMPMRVLSLFWLAIIVTTIFRAFFYSPEMEPVLLVFIMVDVAIFIYGLVVAVQRLAERRRPPPR